MSDSNSIYKLSSKSSLSNDDLLVVSQQDKYSSRKFNSCAMNGGTLMDILFQSVLSMQNFSDAAHILSTDFSQYEHQHDNLYNKLSLDFAYMSQDTHRKFSRSWLSSSFQHAQLLPNAASLSVGNVFIDGTLVPVNVALSAIRRTYVISFDMAEPTVGTLKFVPSTAIKNNSSINYKSIDFDGWLYPDGSTFELSDFALSSQLRQLYGSRYSSKFTLPDFRKFIKLNGIGALAESSMIGAVQGLNVLKRHSHTLTGSMTVNASLILRLIGGGIAQGDGTRGRRGFFHVCSKAKVTYSGKSLPYINSKGDITSGSLMNLYTYIFGENARDIGNYPYPQFTGTETVSMARSGVRQMLYKLGELNGRTFHNSSTVIDADYNTFINTFENISRINLPPMTGFTITANIGGSMSVTLQQVAGSTGETYPPHVILPVMIYVGQRRRKYYE